MSLKLLCLNCKPDFSFLINRGLLLDVTYETCDKVFPTIKSSTAINSQGQTIQLHSPDVFSYLDTNYKTSPYKVILFGWYPKDYSADLNGTGGQTFKKKLSNGARFATTRQDGGNYEAHEFMHILGDILYTDLKKYDVNDQMDTTMVNGTLQRYYKNDRPNDPDSNFSVTWETYKKYLPELNNLGAMPTLKKGSKGEAVKELQRILGIKVDGDFGIRTEASVKVFQVKNNLAVDGIVGAKTWQALKKNSSLAQWGLSPECEKKAEQFLALCSQEGYNLKITSGYRSQEEQDKLYAQGRTTPGKIVTWTKNSKHTKRIAFDVAFSGTNPYPKNFDWEKIGIIGEKVGFKWGGRFKSFKDNLHFEI